MLSEMWSTCVCCVNYCVYLESNSNLILGSRVSHNEVYHLDTIPLKALSPTVLLSSNYLLHHRSENSDRPPTSHLHHGTIKP